MLNYLLLGSALILSIVAAYFSIIGIGIIFPGAIISVIVMASVLELCKIVSAVWTHLNWSNIKFLARTYLTFAVLVLMGITSMGIFGFLSKAHIEHAVDISSVQNRIKDIDNKIALEEDSIKRQKTLIENASLKSTSQKSDIKEIISREEKNISLIYERLDKTSKEDGEKINGLTERLIYLDSQIESLENSGGGIFSNKKSKIEELKNSQQKERGSIELEIDSIKNFTNKSRLDADLKISKIKEKINQLESENKSESVSLDFSESESSIKRSYFSISDLNNKKFELENSNLSLEAEIGPVKYVAELISDVWNVKTDPESAVRIIIVIFVLVFDPLAVIMIICASSSLKKKPQTKRS